MMFCMNCGHEVAEGAAFCPSCGAHMPEVLSGNMVSRTASKMADGVVNRVTSMYGTQEQVDLEFRDFFSEVAKRHTHEEAEQIFICGTATTTPDIRDAGREWPKPWLYSRVLLALVATFLACVGMFKIFDNEILIPNVIVVGSYMVPFATLMFFFEANAPRDVSMLDAIKYFFLGGVGSLVSALILFELIEGSGTGELVPAMLTSLIEELAKLVIVAYLMKKNPGRNYILGGLLIGSAVGAGFAAFESAGYAFRGFIGAYTEGFVNAVQSGGGSITEQGLLEAVTMGFDAAMNNIILRGILAVGGHVAFAAVEGAGIAIVSEGRQFEWTDLLKKEFIALFVFPVVCHGLWDWQPLAQHLGIPFSDVALLIVAIWVLLLVLLRRGMAEVNHAARDASGVTEQ